MSYIYCKHCKRHVEDAKCMPLRTDRQKPKVCYNCGHNINDDGWMCSKCLNYYYCCICKI